jgi:hypothetical protein
MPIGLSTKTVHSVSGTKTMVIHIGMIRS